jgi:glutathione S-transferase
MIRVHRIPFSTNVERVALAAGVKDIAVEWVDHANEDRAQVRALSGQDLVPVAEIDGDVVFDSMRIVERLDQVEPVPALYPASPAERARLDVFVQWFNEIWKAPPNEIDAERERTHPDEERIAALSATTRGTRALFEGMLAEGPFLLGNALSAADICAFPFLKYAVIAPDPSDVDPFHAILHECLRLAEGELPLIARWVERVDALPRA